MPTYQYACTDCEHAFEQVQSFSDDTLTECPQCEGRLRKLFNAVGVVFKGSGFYRTDSRADARTSAGGSSGNGSSSNGSNGAAAARPTGPAPASRRPRPPRRAAPSPPAPVPRARARARRRPPPPLPEGLWRAGAGRRDLT